MKDYVSDDLIGPPLRPDYAVNHKGGSFLQPVAGAANTNYPAANAKATAPLTAQQTGLARALYQAMGKRVMDILFVFASLPVAVPVIMICAIALWIEGGKPFFRQDRLGKNGKRFSIVKLRTMVRDADAQLEQYLATDPALRAEWDTTQKLKHDPRITSVGRFLRATSLDELPQIWNVFVGEMSLVGPRPMLPEQLALYGNANAYFALLPGITGEWQVSARNENLFSFRAEVDARYFRDMSALGDLGLLVKTVGVVVHRTGY